MRTKMSFSYSYSALKISFGGLRCYELYHGTLRNHYPIERYENIIHFTEKDGKHKLPTLYRLIAPLNEIIMNNERHHTITHKTPLFLKLNTLLIHQEVSQRLPSKLSPSHLHFFT